MPVTLKKCHPRGRVQCNAARVCWGNCVFALRKGNHWRRICKADLHMDSSCFTLTSWAKVLLINHLTEARCNYRVLNLGVNKREVEFHSNFLAMNRFEVLNWFTWELMNHSAPSFPAVMTRPSVTTGERAQGFFWIHFATKFFVSDDTWIPHCKAEYAPSTPWSHSPPWMFLSGSCVCTFWIKTNFATE